MKAILVRDWLDDPRDLRVEAVPDPQPGAGEVRIAVAACGVNFADTLIVRGRYQVRPALPFSPGFEFAGTVDAVGPGVTDARPGDRVAARAPFGGFAELALAPASALFPLPDGIAFPEAAAMPVAYGTAAYALRDRGRLRPGECVLVLGATGGVGLAALHLAKAGGARVIAAVGGPQKAEAARAAGADAIVDYESATPLKDQVRALTGGRGVEVVYDPVGGDLLDEAMRSTVWAGRYLIVGFAAGRIPEVRGNLALIKGIEVMGINWPAFAAEEPRAARALLAGCFADRLAGRLPGMPVECRPLAEAPAALADIAARRVRGKIVLLP
ncbi:MAG: NADPH:quinone oxidoreductase family protein [Sneathiellaceae bacterium]